jgi:hypothetical protein
MRRLNRRRVAVSEFALSRPKELSPGRVGTEIAPRPAHRSGLASFSHPALPEVHRVAGVDLAFQARVIDGVGSGKARSSRLNRYHAGCAGRAPVARVAALHRRSRPWIACCSIGQNRRSGHAEPRSTLRAAWLSGDACAVWPRPATHAVCESSASSASFV